MAPRPKRRCVEKSEEQRARTYASAPNEAVTDEDRAKWTGWSDLESEPAIFNSILSRWGVEGVKTCEVTCVDAETLRALPQPIHGIIFLYRYAEPETVEYDEEETKLDNVWFATQNMNNMCGSLALLNMVMNIDGLELGDLLQRFKKDTMAMPPQERGDSVADFAFLRRIHNSWAKKVDMLNQDLKVQQDFKEAKQRRSAGTKRRRKEEEASETAYHFIAYVPVGDRVWQLDGMEQQPEQVEQGGRGDGDWLEQVANLLSDRMAHLIGNDISFNVLAMTSDPLCTVRKQLAVNIKTMQAVDLRLHDIAGGGVNGTKTFDGTAKQNDEMHDAPTAEDVQACVEANECKDDGEEVDTPVGKSLLLLGPSPMFSITKDLLAETSIPGYLRSDIALEEPEDLLTRRIGLMSDQTSLRKAYTETEKTQRSDHARAEARRREYGPLVAKWVRYLAHTDDRKTGKSAMEALIQKL